MSGPVVLVDYGVGNLLSVVAAFEHCGTKLEMTADPKRISRAERIVLPGVGAFGDCMHEIRRRHLEAPILEFARSGRPFLGICVGMQVMMEIGEEFGTHDGLGLIPGRVREIERTTADGRMHKLPHVGWNRLRPANGGTWAGTILADTGVGESVYFVHSFTADPADPHHRLADADYNGRSICAAIQVGSAFGTQFHPERSGEAGLNIIRRFLSL